MLPELQTPQYSTGMLNQTKGSHLYYSLHFIGPSLGHTQMSIHGCVNSQQSAGSSLPTAIVSQQSLSVQGVGSRDFIRMFGCKRKAVGLLTYSRTVKDSDTI